jgi:hypothetical protein
VSRLTTVRESLMKQRRSRAALTMAGRIVPELCSANTRSGQRGRKPGSQARLPAPSPLGTEHASFPALGSSSTKASLCTLLTWELGMLPERPSRYSLAAAVHALRHVGGAHAQCGSVHLLSPTRTVRRAFSRPQSDVGPLSCQVTLKPVSAPLQRGIRFFQYPTPAAPWAAPCGLLSPEGERYGVSTFHAKKSYRVPAFDRDACGSRRT